MQHIYIHYIDISMSYKIFLASLGGPKRFKTVSLLISYFRTKLFLDSFLIRTYCQLGFCLISKIDLERSIDEYLNISFKLFNQKRRKVTCFETTKKTVIKYLFKVLSN